MAKGEDFNVKEVKQSGGADLYREVDSRPATGAVDSRYHTAENAKMVNDQMTAFKNGNLTPSSEYVAYKAQCEDKCLEKQT